VSVLPQLGRIMLFDELLTSSARYEAISEVPPARFPCALLGSKSEA